MKEFIAAFLLPPGFSVLLGILAIIYWNKRKFLARFLIVISISFMWISSTEAFGRIIAFQWIKQIPKPSDDIDISKTDLIVMLGGGIDYIGDFGWSPTQSSYRRALVAFELQNHVGSRVPILINGGKTEGLHNPSEAEIIKKQFDKKNAQITPVLLEEKSTNTYENAVQAAAIIENRGVKQFFLVTSEVHMPRAIAVFRGMGMDPIPLPVVNVTRSNGFKFSEFLPSDKGLRLTRSVIYELLATLQYWAAGHLRLEDLNNSYAFEK